MEREVKEALLSLVESMRGSDVYKRYQLSAASVREFPGVFERIMELRQLTIALYEDPDAEDLLEKSEELALLYEELQKRPEVNAFLEAEEELVSMLQQINREIFGALDVYLPPED